MTLQEIDSIHQNVAAEMRLEFPMVNFSSSIQSAAYGFVSLTIKVEPAAHSVRNPVLAADQKDYREAFIRLIKNELVKAELAMGRDS